MTPCWRAASSSDSNTFPRGMKISGIAGKVLMISSTLANIQPVVSPSHG